MELESIIIVFTYLCVFLIGVILGRVTMILQYELGRPNSEQLTEKERIEMKSKALRNAIRREKLLRI